MEISTDERFASSLQYIRARIGGKIVDDGNRIKLITESKNTRAVLDALADVIVTDCKSYYISSRIRLLVEDNAARGAFIKALSTFDRDTDKIIAKTVLDSFYSRSDCCVCHIDGIYEFMLDILKNRWDEVCMLANDNIHYLVCKKTFMELLHFLISNIESSTDREELLAMIAHL